MRFFDPPAFAATYEWVTIERFCRTTFVVIHNVNLPNHPGWIRSYLLGLPEWREVAGGYTPHDLTWLYTLRKDVHGQEGVAEHPLVQMFIPRQWSVLMRTVD